MSNSSRFSAISQPTREDLPCVAATQRWVNTSGEYAYNNIWYCGLKSLPEVAPDDADTSMTDGWNVSTIATSTTHTATMRVVSREDDPGEMDADGSTVRGFLGDHDHDIHMDEDNNSDEDNASSALTSLPSRYNTPKKTTSKPLFDDTTSINSQDEQGGETAIDDLILACAEQEVEDDDVKSYEECDDRASQMASE
jgi:hypothetical protein